MPALPTKQFWKEAPMRKIIGITGKSGVGKTTIAKMLAEKHTNCTYINLDKIGNGLLTNPEIVEILIQKFGSQILEERAGR